VREREKIKESEKTLFHEFVKSKAQHKKQTNLKDMSVPSHHINYS
jgi:hypothetical protein